MKPKNLKAAFSWDERKPLLQDGIFHVPSHYFDYPTFCFPSWSDIKLFGNNNPVYIEYCSGNGDWIINRAIKYPFVNWVAVEKRYDRVRKIWSKSKNKQLKNILIVCSEAWTFSLNYLKDETVDEIFINFPDPWPKNKHKKHRLMQPRFIHEIHRTLKTGKTITFVSDDEDYVNSTKELFFKDKNFQLSDLQDNQDYGSSRFEEMWRSQNKKIHYMQFYKLFK